MVYEKIVAQLTEKNVPFDILTHEVIRTAADAERAVPGIVDDLVKTVAFKVKDGGWVLAGVPARARIDYKKLAALVGINRRMLRSLSPDQVKAELGFEVGGVGPFSINPDITIFFDSSLAGAGKVYCGSGKNTRTVAIEFTDLVAVSGGTLESITKIPV
ncbi:MAG: YbaK/EbsC family protein [Chloroflexota bacterium]